MKKLLTLLLFVSISVVGRSQENDTVPDLLPYEDDASGLFISKVVEVKDKSQKDLATQFKNWASTSFVNLREVMVSETENQIVLNYKIDAGSYIKTMGMKIPMSYGWYVRMVVQFKDGKARAQFYDDGNVYKPGEYSQYGSVPATESRTIFIHSMKNKPENIKALHKAGGTGMWYDIHYQWQGKVMSMVSSFEKGMLDATIVGKKDDF